MDGLEHVDDPLRVLKQAGAPAFVGDLGGGAAQVPVEMTVAEISEQTAEGDEVVGFVVEQLRHRRQCGVVFRQNVGEHGRLEAGEALGGDEWRHGGVETRKMGVKDLPKQGIGDSPDRGEIEKVTLWRLHGIGGECDTAK